jgi:hypothetical protein
MGENICMYIFILRARWKIEKTDTAMQKLNQKALLKQEKLNDTQC